MLTQKINEIFKNQNFEEVYNYLKTLQTNNNILNLSFAEGVIDILLTVKSDYNSLLTALIYPFVKTEVLKIEEVKNLINDDSFGMLEALLKMEQLKINTRESQNQHIKDMFIAMAKDLRVVILKLAIVQQNVANLLKLDKKEQQDLMHQVKEIFAPLAAMLGIGYIKNTLEKEVFLFYKPVEYAKLNMQLHKYFESRNKQIELTIQKIKEEIKPINAQVYGRHKQISSIYKKLERNNLDLTQIYDILAVRVIVETVEECYSVLGKIHALYKPLGRFKDYIAQPKENGYQSLHTTVIVENGDPLEIQIRTSEMHSYAEYGLAAHWAYKEKRKVNESDKKISYIRSVLELYKEKSPEELLDALKIDVYSGNIFVQTPMGKILQFPEGSTPIDFAYAIHSKIGDTCVGAKVNDKMVPLNTMLNNGDVVEIITNPNSKGPSRDWLKIVKTADARSKINAFFRREMKEENIKKGKSILESTAKAKNINLSKLFKEEFLEEVLDKYAFASLDDMYATLGYGGITATQILNRLTNLYNEQEKENQKIELQTDAIIIPKQSLHKGNVVNVLGFSNLMTKFAKCCNPLPGDEIIGYVSRGKGVTVHRINCESLTKCEEERLIECGWNLHLNDTFTGYITVIAINSPNSIAQISKKIADMKLNIVSLKTTSKNREQMVIHLGILVKNKSDLDDLVTKINNLSYVIDVNRGV